MDKGISICIPTYEYDGMGGLFLTELFESILKQDFKDYEVCVSDHSVDDEIEKLCKEYRNSFPMVYYRNIYDRDNSPANTNCAIDLAQREIVKIMFQDDWFYSDSALSLISRSMNKTWLVCGCNHFHGGKFTRTMIPRWNDKIFERNTISSPSVLTIKGDVADRFDTELIMKMDVDYYYRLYQLYGEPVIIDEPLITNRLHNKQISAQYKRMKKKIPNEYDYCKKKYSI